MSEDPFTLFASWYEEARKAEINDPDAMSLATATPDGRPSVRIVLMKEHGERGFTFYTNGDSRKGGELEANPNAALLFHWKTLRRQVRIEGPVEQVNGAEADRYFASRSRESQLGACASLQSRPLDSRETFERRYDELQRELEGRDVPRPERWTGFRVIPRVMEFWSDRPHRLHERRLFRRAGTSWAEELLYP